MIGGINFKTYIFRFCEYLTYIDTERKGCKHQRASKWTSKWFLCKCMDFFLGNELRFESNHSSKVKENLLHLNLQILANVHSIDNTNISNSCAHNFDDCANVLND